MTSVDSGYRLMRIGKAEVLASEAAIGFIRDALESAGTLYRYAARHGDAAAIAGRATLYLIPGPNGGRWVVRKLTHGGLLAPLTGDLFLRLRTPRPFNELHISARLRELSIPTPRVIAAVVYPRGVRYRGEVVREEIGGARDLAQFLFLDPGVARARRIAALGSAGRLVRQCLAAGLIHPDLNLRNILVDSGSPARPAHILDLEKCRLAARLAPSQIQRMLRRLRSSARRFEGRCDRALEAAAWEAFYAAYSGRDEPAD